MSRPTGAALRRWFTAGGPAALATACIAAAARAQSDLPPGFRSSPLRIDPPVRSPAAAPNPFATSVAPPGSTSPWLEFTFYTPPAIVLGAILVVVLASLLVAQFGVYRLALKQNVRAGVHPGIVAKSVMVWTAGMILLATYVIVATFAAGTVGSGYFTALWAVVVLATLLLTLFRFVIARWGLTLLAVLAVAALMLAFEIV
ncbi:MAG TPA: hypothetical protein VD995_31005 [Azospirillum sp.]|nr:hypothetical protein [Azospirillum sp.]